MRYAQIGTAVVVAPALVVVLLGGLVANVSALAASSPMDPYRAVDVTPASAIAAVQAMVDHPVTGNAASRAPVAAVRTTDLSTTPPVDGKLYRFYDVEGADVSAIVDAHDGHVAQLLMMSRIPKVRSAATINDEQALDIASSYLADQGIPVDGMASSVQLDDRGAALVYSVTWQRIVNDALVPDSRLVQLDAGTGVIFNVHNTRRPYANPPVAAIARARAITIAQDVAATSGVNAPAAYRLLDATLQVNFNDQGDQGLAWVVKVFSGDSADSTGFVEVTVDAVSGSSTVTGRG